MSNRQGDSAEHKWMEGELYAVLEHSPLGICVRRRTGELVFANEAWKRIWALSDQEIQRAEQTNTDLPLGERYPHLKDIADEVRRVFESGGEFHVPELECKNPRPNAAEWVSQYFYALCNEHGQVERVVIMTQDITQRKQAEEELDLAIAAVQESNARLAQYATDLEESNYLKELFIDILRHDLINPVNAILGFSGVLLDQAHTAEEKEAFAAIRVSGEKLLEVIHNASLHAQLESGDDLPREPHDLNKLFQKVLASFALMLERRRMTVDYRPVGERWARVSSIIEDVFANLVSNAIKYSPPGKRIEIDIQETPEEQKIYVKDWGYGIPDEDKTKVFGRLTRLVDSSSIMGIGLGLAIVQRIVELHKGRVWVEDNPEGGSVFCIDLPKGV